MMSMFRKICLIAIAAMLMPPALHAKEGDNIEASVGDFKIIHLWTSKPDKFMEEWRGPTPPTLPTTSTTQRNKPIQQFILFANCTADDAGNCQLDAQLDIFAPDGTRYGEVLKFPAANKIPAGPRNNILMAPGGIGLKIEDREQLGEYRLELAVTDVNAKVTAKSIVHIDVTAASEQKDGVAE